MIKIGIYHLAPEQIVAVLPGDNGYTQINTTSEVFFVIESPEEVTRKILEYKLAMEDFKVCLTIADAPTRNVEKQLQRLAGLGE